jgi:hypothetical protein
LLTGAAAGAERSAPGLHLALPANRWCHRGTIRPRYLPSDHEIPRAHPWIVGVTARVSRRSSQHVKRSRFAALAGQVHAGARPTLVPQRRSIPTSLGWTCDLCCQPSVSRPWCCTGPTSPLPHPARSLPRRPHPGAQFVEIAGAFHRHHAPHRDQQRVLIDDVGAREQSDAAKGDGADALAANFLASGI